MRYLDLHDLIFHSQSSRQYFLSLPVSLQLKLHEYNSWIRCAADLHRQVLSIEKIEHQLAVSDNLL